MVIRLGTALLLSCASLAVTADLRAGTSPQDSRQKPQKEPDYSGNTWVWLEGEAGFSEVGFRTFQFDSEKLQGGFTETRESAPLLGLGVGARLSFLTIGPRARAAILDRWDFYTVGGELGVHVPIWRIEPHIEAELGYAALANPEPGTVDDGGPTTLSGYYARIGGGFDIRFTRNLTLGAKLGWGVHAVAPPGMSVMTTLQKVSSDTSGAASETVERVRRTLESADGTSWGTTFGMTMVLGVRY